MVQKKVDLDMFGYMVRGAGVLILVFLLLYFANTGLRRNVAGRKAEKLLNQGIKASEIGKFQQGLRLIKQGGEVARRGMRASKNSKELSKLTGIAGAAYFWQGVFLLRQVQQKYAEERKTSVLDGDSFRLPASELDGAETAFKKALEFRPEKAETYRLLGYIYREKGVFLEAVRALEKAVDKREKYAEAFNDLGEAYYMVKQYDKAREFYEKAILADDNLASAYLNLGMLYFYDKAAKKQSITQAKSRKNLLRFLTLAKNNSVQQEDVVRARKLLGELPTK